MGAFSRHENAVKTRMIMVTLPHISAKLVNMPRIAANLSAIKEKLPKNCQLVVVSKYRSVEEIREVYASGERHFGENRVQALIERKEALPDDIKWHLIGHLQSNKVKYIAPFIYMIHSIDSYKLLAEVNEQGRKNNRILNCLLQVHVAQEETKFGFTPEELKYMLQETQWRDLQNVQICGLMAMASNTQNQSLIESEYALVQSLFKELKLGIFSKSESFKEISIGMSSDYSTAIKHGSTLVRIGSAVFE
jgi:PLP dependent protein